MYVQPIACGVAFHLILQSQSNWSFCNGTWHKRGRELVVMCVYEKNPIKET